MRLREDRIIVDDSDEFGIDDDGSGYIAAVVIWHGIDAPDNEVHLSISPRAVRTMADLLEKDET